MRVAIVHYHLDHGGVTRVIEAASSALTDSNIRHIVLTGDAKGGRHVPGLGYLTDPGELTAGQLTANLRAAATEALGGPPDIWHFHNHSLGKNRLLPRVISQLAEAGERLVLQIHDLAEQGRAENYPLIAGNRELYPFSPRIHYVFLNSRDLALFTAAGLPPENATLFPNPIAIGESPFAPTDSSPPLLFAPVRGIRRKNLGELVLLSALSPAGTRVAVSRAPENPKALPIHDTWRNFVAKHHLPIGFDVVDHYSPVPGAATDFDSWARHASHFVTTSVSEGFGLTFLEAIAHGKPLVGRNLPHLTADHAAHGIRAGRLYDAILVPIEWVDIRILRDHLTLDLERDHRFYQLPLSGNPVGTAIASMVRDGLVDFGNLSEPLQQGIVERLADPTQRPIPLVQSAGITRPAVDWLEETLAERIPTATRDQLAPYSLENYQKSIGNLYAQLVGSPAVPLRHVPPAAILASCQRPENFHFLLSSLRPDPLQGKRYRAVVFDIYGTLLIAPSGGVKPDPFADPVVREILRQHGYTPPASPTAELHAAVVRHHAAAEVPFPEIDLRVLWREILSIEPGNDITPLIQEIEDAWHPSKPMPGAEKFIQRLSRTGISLGLLSNAQCNTLGALGPISDLFAPELTVLSYQHRIAKPAPELFQILADRLAGRGISPDETLYIGNDPLHDIVPAAAAGVRTALFTGHPDSLRPGECRPDIVFDHWTELHELF
ncbi:MAG: HAD family hydrolase [Luteolibacter sp.]|uniref:HAD family hydrolase n=1 Tax=Luteolibacter sp. TaxID=1962973 RepID=UPI0032642444